MALPGPYCSIFGDRGALAYDQDQRSIRLCYLDPQFRWPDAVADAGTPSPDQGLCAELELPWREETRKVQPETNMWELVEIDMARHLHAALRSQVPFPVTSAHALEVVRVTEIVKKQNPHFAWAV